MLSDAVRSVARNAGLAVVPYESHLGFTVIREDDDLYFFFVLNLARAPTGRRRNRRPALTIPGGEG